MAEIVVASHNAGKLREFADLIAPFGLEARVGRRIRPAGAGRDRHDLRGERLHQGACRGRWPPACRRCRTIPACASMRSTAQPGVYTANWAETPDGTRDFGIAMQKVEDCCAAGRARSSRSSAPAVSSPSSAWPGRMAMPNIFAARSRARWSGRRAATLGFGYDPVFLPDGYDKTFGEMTAEEKHGWKPGDSRGAVAPRPRLPEIRAGEAGLGMRRSANPASASMSTGRSARPNAPIATSTAMSATSRSTRSALPRPSRPSWRRCARRTGPREVTSIFLGGGTPSLMKPETVGAVLDAVAQNWTVADGIEVTLEANPSSVEADALPRLSRGRRQPRLARRAGAERPRPANSSAGCTMSRRR